MFSIGVIIQDVIPFGNVLKDRCGDFPTRILSEKERSYTREVI